MKRLAIFVHFDRDGVVDPYVIFYLDRLKEVVNDIVFITTSLLDDKNIKKIEFLCHKIICRENIGYDFMSYKTGLEVSCLDDYDEVIICNDSVYGPFYPLNLLMDKMSVDECDYWGMSESFQFSHHLQSYFIVFKKKVFESDIFKQFWKNVKVIESKGDLILAYEIGLSQQFQSIGFKQGVVCRIMDEKQEAYKKMIVFVLQGSYKKARNVYKRCHDGGSFACNTTLLFWDVLMLKSAMPFLKIAVLKHNAFRLRQTDEYQKIIKSKGWNYPVELIEQHLQRFQH